MKDSCLDKVVDSSIHGFQLFKRELNYSLGKDVFDENPTMGGGVVLGHIKLLTFSVAALKPGYGTYTASKAAVEVIVKIMAQELKGTGITANCVAPGPIATEMFFKGKTEEMIQKFIDLTPSSRLGTADDIAPVVGFLAGDAGDWINGQVIRVNGGYV
ncbi:NADPH-dependent aldehyde reductase-like protein, chloroplastic [Artemisia annua]|uniref:NADPH-dependent aldehyde reductase-like protein, chloroplastic n=1 Tax=Artemisia annua TaxID=35608 RepID=A0A2U1L939_ARTAN|nr:NADPH-dependent aldehyde reductase-like protein, chloroplastic [Artemisia annua]